MNKECAKHILAPSAVACDISQLRASAHPRGAFLISRNELSHVSMTRSFLDIKKGKPYWFAFFELCIIGFNQNQTLYISLLLQDNGNESFRSSLKHLLRHLYTGNGCIPSFPSLVKRKCARVTKNGQPRENSRGCLLRQSRDGISSAPA